MEDNILTLSIGFGHSLILGHTPDKVFELIQEKTMKDVKCPDGKCSTGKFGLFDSSTPNYATFYPGVKPEDFKPKDEDFITPTFRLLSAVTVHRNYSPVYFPDELLKNSMNLLVGQTVNIDHETAIGNAIGTVESVEWQESYKDKSGVIVPAGINGKLKIDAKSNPRIARGILMDPPSIHSNSVTISFAWEKSHPEMEDNEFWSKLGTYDKDGQLIQRVATKVQAYHETSLVSHGADPFAQVVKGKKINNPTYAGIKDDQLSFSYYSYKTDNLKEGSRLELNLTKDNNQNQSQIKMEQFFELVQKAFNLEAAPTKENFTEIVEGLGATQTDNATKLTSLKADLDKFNAKFSGIELTEDGKLKEGDIAKFVDVDPELSSFAEIGKASLAADKKEAIRLYELTAGDDKQEAIIETINNADSKATTAFLKQYKELADKDFPMVCSSCGSDEVSRRSTQAGQDSSQGKSQLDLSDPQDALADFKAKRLKKSQEK